jgi:hypothetical protein
MPIALGAAGVPLLGIKDIAKLREQVTTQRQTIGQDGFASITSREAWTNYIVARSTTQKLRSTLKQRMRKAEKKIAYTEDKRARAFVGALLGTSGDDLGAAAWEAAQGIEIEGKLFYTDPSGFETRVNTLIEKHFVSDDLRTMLDSGFVSQIYLQASMELYSRSASRAIGQ